MRLTLLISDDCGVTAFFYWRTITDGAALIPLQAINNASGIQSIMVLSPLSQFPRLPYLTSVSTPGVMSAYKDRQPSSGAPDRDTQANAGPVNPLNFYGQGTDISSFCQQHPDTANELAHACRHLIMDKLRDVSELAPNLRDALPSLGQMASVWWKNGRSSCSSSQPIGLSAPEPPTEASGLDAARTVAADLAHEATRFVI